VAKAVILPDFSSLRLELISRSDHVGKVEQRMAMGDVTVQFYGLLSVSSVQMFHIPLAFFMFRITELRWARIAQSV
jgi:hypothetical protein